jgi:hypothetical protein
MGITVSEVGLPTGERSLEINQAHATLAMAGLHLFETTTGTVKIIAANPNPFWQYPEADKISAITSFSKLAFDGVNF